MIGTLITIAGGYTAYRLWGDYRGLSIFTIIVTLYQASSLSIINRENNRWQIVLNMLSTFIIIGMCATSFLLPVGQSQETSQPHDTSDTIPPAPLDISDSESSENTYVPPVPPKQVAPPQTAPYVPPGSGQQSGGSVDWEAIDKKLGIEQPKTNDEEPSVITLDEFTKVEVGMSYEEAVKIIGGEGEQISAFSNHTSYQWKGEAQHSSATFSFSDNKLTYKFQHGLE